MKDLPKRCFLLKVFKYHSCINELGKIEERILYKTFLLVCRAATYACVEVLLLQQKKS